MGWPHKASHPCGLEVPEKCGRCVPRNGLSSPSLVCVLGFTGPVRGVEAWKFPQAVSSSPERVHGATESSLWWGRLGGGPTGLLSLTARPGDAAAPRQGGYSARSCWEEGARDPTCVQARRRQPPPSLPREGSGRATWLPALCARHPEPETLSSRLLALFRKLAGGEGETYWFGAPFFFGHWSFCEHVVRPPLAR